MIRKNKPKALIVSISSDIGYSLAKRWRQRGMQVGGTFRTASPLVDDLKVRDIKTFLCDVGNEASVRKTAAQLSKTFAKWDYLVLCPGTRNQSGLLQNVILPNGKDQWL